MVEIDEEPLGFLFAYSRGAYPREAIVALRGRTSAEGVVSIKEAVVPMTRTEGHHFSTWSLSGVADSATVGMGHSHPSGVLKPSEQDLRSFFGKVMLIVAPPFNDESCARFFGRNGEEVPFKVIWKSPFRRFSFDG